MHELTLTTLAGGILASGGHGHGRAIMLAVLLIIIVAVVAGWVVYAKRTRTNRRQP